MFRKLVGLLTATVMLTLMLCVNVNASGLTSANKSTGNMTVKGATGNSPWTRSQPSGADNTRTWVTMSTSGTVTAVTHIVQGYSNTYNAKFAHTTFRFRSTNAFQLRIRNGSDNKQWMNFGSDGSISANSNGVNKDRTWTPGTEHRLDIVADVVKGVGYLYIDKKLASYSTNLQQDGTWRGYSIYTSGTWENGDSYEWMADNSTRFYAYNDTADYTVCLEDVLADCGIASKSSEDNSMIFAHNEAHDYFKTAYSSTHTYSDNDTVTVEGDYYAAGNDARVFMQMLSGFYAEKSNTKIIGGALLYISYKQRINSGSRVELRLRNNATNLNNNRLSFVPKNGKILVSSFDNVERMLNKSWTDEVDVGIVIDMADRKAYTFIDGKKLGGAYDYSSAGDYFHDIRMYLNGTENNSISSVTLTDWTMKLYDATKDANGLCAEIEGKPVYFTEAGNDFNDDGNSIAMSVTAAKTLGAEPISKAWVAVVVYDDQEFLLDSSAWEFEDGVTNPNISFEHTGAESKVKVFCIGQNFNSIATVNVFDINNDIQ